MSVVAIDLFAGLGGFTAGARMAGAQVAWAANHWPVAVEWHGINHPDVHHECQDLHQCDWSLVPPHDVVMASPACQGHSHARGVDRPHHDASRSTAWAVVSCAEVHRPSVIVVENVPEFRTWVLWPAWKGALEALGYAVRSYVIDAADLGVPQHRRRLFVLASRSASPFDLCLTPKDHVPASAIIDWDSGTWSKIRRPGRSRRTLSRIKAGRAALGDRFVAPYYGTGSGRTGRSLDRPIGTITTRDRWSVIDGPRMRMLTVDEYRQAMGFPADTKLPATRATAIHLLGNAVCPPVVAEIITQITARA